MLAAVAAGPVDLTVALSGAGVGHGGQLAPSEKSLRIDLIGRKQCWIFNLDPAFILIVVTKI